MHNTLRIATFNIHKGLTHFNARFSLREQRELLRRIQPDVVFLQEVRDEVAVMQPPAFNRMAHTFSHIFSGGYAAGYYSYKWAEVLSADAYAAFEETADAHGQPSIETGRRYRQAILEAGGSRPALESFKAFRGREPNLDALLRHQGMA